MGWIEDYIQYNSSQESPAEFHKWVGLSIIAATLNRRVSLPRISDEGIVFYTVYPGQLVICLVAGAGHCRKSTAITLGKSFMKEVGVQLYDGKITPERLLNKLGSMPNGKPVLTIVASELSSFLSKASYNDGLIDNLIKLFDCESNPYETQKAIVKLNDPCLTGLWASTPYSLGQSIPAQAHDTGFLSRVLFVFSDRPGKAASLANNSSDIDPGKRQHAIDLRTTLVARLRGYSVLSGTYIWDTSARQWFNDYYESYRRSGAADDEGYPQRRPDHLLRISMCLSASDGTGTNLRLSRAVLESADQWLKEIEGDFPKAFAYIGQHTNAEKYAKIMKVFRDKARELGVRQAVVQGDELYTKVIKHFASPGELQQHLQGLIEAGNIGCLGRDKTTNRFIYTVLKELY